MQQSYMLGCPEGQEARLLAAVKQSMRAMSGIRDAGKIRGARAHRCAGGPQCRF
ncbi:hypothetical protein [Comamonas sp. JC664]|uniref:hypothetical protein n=1 Tax=Comamonas sp. JC664 TaxID=2801917 RepID=UPI00366CE469